MDLWLKVLVVRQASIWEFPKIGDPSKIRYPLLHDDTACPVGGYQYEGGLGTCGAPVDRAP